MKLQHLWAVTRKEFFHITRDPGTLVLMTVGPVFLMLMLVYALTADVKNVPVAVVNIAANARSQELVQEVQATGVVRVTQMLANVQVADPLLERGDVRAVLVIPAGYGDTVNFVIGKLPTLKIIVDGTEPLSAERILETIYTASEAHLRQIATETLSKIPGFDLSQFSDPVKIETETRYNPGLRNVVDFYPGLTAVVLSLPGVALALALAREKELGTLEQLVAMPINKLALLLGKIVPYMLFGMVDMFLLVGIGRLMYDVPFRGSLLGYALFSFFFLFSNMALGLLISVLLGSQQLAMVVAFLVFFFPSFFLSGVFFPLKVMPTIVQFELQFLPVTHYVTASKAMYLQGTALTGLDFDFIALLLVGTSILGLSVVLFRKKVA